MDAPPFPFIGAGEASYFEWAEMFACFERAPSTSEAAAIAAEVPVPLRDTIEWNGALLWVASEQGVGRLIDAAYARTPKPPADLTVRGKHTIAAATAYARFNAAIEAWLLAAHAHVPIRVAYRREDHEAGGTEHSDWHRASVPKIPQILEVLTAGLTEKLAALALRLAGVATDAGLDVAASMIAQFEAAEQAEADRAYAEKKARHADQKQAAAAALGPPSVSYAGVRTRAELAAPLAALAKVLPATAKRLARMSKAGLSVRAGATADALAAAETGLGVELTPEHRALLTAFDGGTIGELTLLGTASGGATGDAELVAFTRAWCGPSQGYTLIGRTDRDHVLALVRRKGTVYLLAGTCGLGGGQINRESKKLDTALDHVLKTGTI